MAEILKDEIMSDEQLDGVAGGTVAENKKDMQFLKDLGLVPQGASYMESDTLTRAFAKKGINMTTHYNDTNNNEYFTANGKQITREAALKQVLSKSGKVNPYTGKEIKLADYL